MNRILSALTVLLLTINCNSLIARNIRDTLGIGQRVHFTENKGQWEDKVLFRSVLHDADIFLEKGRFTIVAADPRNPRGKGYLNDKNNNTIYRFHAYHLNFLNAGTPVASGLFPEDTYENYFIGNDPQKWASKVLVYEAVEYKNLYNGINLKVYSANNALKYDFLVSPHSDPSQIRVSYDGVDGVRLQNGNIIVKTSVLDIVEIKPYAYQKDGDSEAEVECNYVLKNGVISFELGSYDSSKPLIIDPMLIFSTYTGSTADNWGTTAAFDSKKNTYSAGLVFGNGYPTTTGAFQTTLGGNCDVAVIKLDTAGSRRVYATYIGGNNADMPHSLYVNEFDELVILGTTGSSNFPTSQNAYCRTFHGGINISYLGSSTMSFPNGSDIFVCRLSDDGTQLPASTYIGGSGNDGLNYKQRFSSSNDRVMLGNDSLYFNYGDGARGELITDDLNNVYVGSCTFSTDFPTTANVFQPTSNGKQEGVVFKLDYNLSNLLWSSYLGGSNDDAAYSIDTDDEYNLVVCGGTNSTNFPTTPNGYRTTYQGGSADAFIAKISYDGTTLMSSTYFGSPAYDQSYFVRTGKKNHIFTFGQTKASGSTLIHNALYNVPNSGQFIARFGADLDTLIWSTVFGTGSGVPNISPTAFAADICDRVYAAGWGRLFCGYYLGGQVIPWNTYGTHNMQVSPNAIQSTTDGQDFYIMCITETANQLDYATFFGEQHVNSNGNSGHDHVDGGTSRFDKMATLYQSVCASCGGCQGFPTTAGALSSSNNSSNCNNGIFRMNVHNDFPVADFIRPPAGCTPDTVRFQNTGRGDSFKWFFGDGTISYSTNPTHIYTAPGTYTITLVAYLNNGCKSTDTIRKQVLVLGHNQSLNPISTCPGQLIQIGQSPQLGCTYHWLTGNVSDPNIANPYTRIYDDTTLRLVISNEGCSDTVSQQISIIHPSITIIRDSSDCTSPIFLSANVSPAGNYTYHWSSRRNFRDTLNFNMGMPDVYIYLTTGQYFYLKVFDANGCYATDSVFVNFISIAMPVNYTNPTCPGGCDGSASVTTSGATPPFNFTWSTGNRTDSSVYNLCPGSYNVSVVDAKGCSVSQQFTLTAPLRPVITKNVTNTNCSASCNGSINIQISGIRNPYTFSWSDSVNSTLSRNNLCIGTYILKITDSAGCEYFDTTTIVELASYTDQKTFRNACADVCDGQATLSPQGGISPYTYLWDDGSSAQNRTDLCPGMHIVKITDSVNCSIYDTVSIIEVRSFDNIRAWADDTVIVVGESTNLHVTPIPNGNYSWEPAGSLGTPNQPNTNAHPSDTTMYYITVIDSNGCRYLDSIYMPCVDVICGRPNIFIPNAFSPNDDGLNDRLCFRGEWLVSFHIAIFNRWGEKVYESDDINECWDGTFKNEKCQSGVYMYSCEIECRGHQSHNFKGDITLIK